MTETLSDTHSPADPILDVRNLSKSFGTEKTGGAVEVLKNLSFTVGRGEFLTILGASGCGKTTLLRILCGLETADEGTVLLDGGDITALAPEKRPVNTVFQSYALFPHMTVYDNIAYPLKLKHTPKSAIRRRVGEMLDMVQMTGFEGRYPAALSGGQRQRIAIARALIASPQILLLDEPLGALDFHLRRRMQTELKRIQRALGITFLYITHDQEEALNMSDRIAIMHGGGFLQLDTPAVIYDSPADTRCARFVGESNLLPAVFSAPVDCDLVAVSVGGQTLCVRRGAYPPDAFAALKPGSPVTLSVRSEQLQLCSSTVPADSILLSGSVSEISFTGGVQHITFTPQGLPDTSLVAVRYGMEQNLAPGMTAAFSLSDGAAALCLEESAT